MPPQRSSGAESPVTSDAQTDSLSEGSDSESLAMNKPSPSNPEEHIAHAWSLPIPHPTPSRLTPHQRLLIQSLASDPTGVVSRASAAVQHWAKRKAELEPAQKAFCEKLPADKRPTLGKLNILLLTEMLHACQHSDEHYIQDVPLDVGPYLGISNVTDRVRHDKRGCLVTTSSESLTQACLGIATRDAYGLHTEVA